MIELAIPTMNKKDPLIAVPTGEYISSITCGVMTRTYYRPNVTRSSEFSVYVRADNYSDVLVASTLQVCPE